MRQRRKPTSASLTARHLFIFLPLHLLHLLLLYQLLLGYGIILFCRNHSKGAGISLGFWSIKYTCVIRMNFSSGVTIASCPGRKTCWLSKSNTVHHIAKNQNPKPHRWVRVYSINGKVKNWEKKIISFMGYLELHVEKSFWLDRKEKTHKTAGVK